MFAQLMSAHRRGEHFGSAVAANEYKEEELAAALMVIIQLKNK